MQTNPNQDNSNGVQSKHCPDGNGNGGGGGGSGPGHRGGANQDHSSTTLFDVKIGVGMDIDIQGENGERQFRKDLVEKICMPFASIPLKPHILIFNQSIW